MSPEDVQDLTHVLLIELLAIETQDVLRGDQTVQRLGKVGPSNTLANMAKTTVRNRYQEHDDAHGLTREILSLESNANEIYYRHELSQDENQSETGGPVDEPPSATPFAVPPSLTETPSALTLPIVVAGTSKITSAPGPIIDRPITPLEAIRAIVVIRLKKKEAASLAVAASVRELCGGRSTMQNEIIGDLLKEFGSLPEGAEDMPIVDLATSIETKSAGQLGDVTRSLVWRMVATKLHGSWSLTNARSHIQTKWRLSAGRQDSIFLIALTMQPTGRLATELDCELFLDAATAKYADEVGLVLTAVSDQVPGTQESMPVASRQTTTAHGQHSLPNWVLEPMGPSTRALLRENEAQIAQLKQTMEGLQLQADAWGVEHGDDYSEGVSPVFTAEKVRAYDTWWNWGQEEYLRLSHRIWTSTDGVADDIRRQCRSLANRSSPAMLRMMQRTRLELQKHNISAKAEIAEALEATRELCQESLELSPRIPPPQRSRPVTAIDLEGNIVYTETNRDRPEPNAGRPEAKQCDCGCKASTGYNKPCTQNNSLPSVCDMYGQGVSVSLDEHVFEVTQNGSVVTGQIKSSGQGGAANEGQITISKTNPHRRSVADFRLTDNGPRLIGDPMKVSGVQCRVSEVPSAGCYPLCTCLYPPIDMRLGSRAPMVYRVERKRDLWKGYASDLTAAYIAQLEDKAGLQLIANSRTLLTGAGKNSLGEAVLIALLQGGCKVLVTTNSYSYDTTKRFQRLYRKYGGRGSQLHVAPFNQGSRRDIEALIDFVYKGRGAGGLGWDLEHIIPFAAISENGRTIDGIDGRSELAHRLMLTNIIRLLGAVKWQKAARGVVNKPTQVILPLSPNHGTFGSDGLYAESKLALESLATKWKSEDWAEYLSICEAKIGWTRGTSLMRDNDIVAAGIEKAGMRTFSREEMAFQVVALMIGRVHEACQIEPLRVDLDGGMDQLHDLKEIVNDVRRVLQEESDIVRAVSEDRLRDQVIVKGPVETLRQREGQPHRIEKRTAVSDQRSQNFRIMTTRSDL